MEEQPQSLASQKRRHLVYPQFNPDPFLIFIYSEMGGIKTTHITQLYHDLTQEVNRWECPVLILKPTIDTREGNPEEVISRIKTRAPAMPLAPEDDPLEIFDTWESVHNTPKPLILCVDECQFLTPKQAYAMRTIVDKHRVKVMCYGLRNDFRFQPWPATTILFAQCDQAREFESYCVCTRKATVSARIDKATYKVMKEGPTVLIEAENDKFFYRQLCSEHYHVGDVSSYYRDSAVSTPTLARGDPNPLVIRPN